MKRTLIRYKTKPELAEKRSAENRPRPKLSDADRDRLGAYVAHFNARDFDAIRAMIADDVRRPTPDDMPAGSGRPGIATRAG